MSDEIEIHIQDEDGKPIDLSNTYIYRDDSGVIVETRDGYRISIVSRSELEEMINQSSGDDPSVYVMDLVNDRRWCIDIPRISDVKTAYVRGEITEVELEQQIEQAFEHYGDPDDTSSTDSTAPM